MCIALAYVRMLLVEDPEFCLSHLNEGVSPSGSRHCQTDPRFPAIDTVAVSISQRGTHE